MDAFWQAASRARARAVSRPSISPKVRCPPKVCAMTPGASMVANTRTAPPSTWPAPSTRASFSSLSTPFWIDSTPVSGPTTGRISAAASSVPKDFTQNSTRSAGGRPSRRSTAGARTLHSPSTADLIRRPSARSAAKCAPRATKVTSSPARASLAPKYPPVPPEPITTMRMGAMLREARRVVKLRRGILDPRERFLSRRRRRGGTPGRRVPPIPLRRSARRQLQGQPDQSRHRDGPGRRGDHPRRHPRPVPGARRPRRGERRAERERAAPLDRGSARRHHELRARAADLLRVDRARAGRRPGGGRPLRSQSRRVLRGRARPRGHPERRAPARLRDAHARPKLARHELPERPADRPAQQPRRARRPHPALPQRAQPGLRRARARRRRGRPARRLLGAAAGRLGHRGGRATDPGGGRRRDRGYRGSARPGGAHHRGLERPHPFRPAPRPQGGRGHAMTEETKAPPVHVRTIRVEVARAGEHELEITATLVDERPRDNSRCFTREVNERFGRQRGCAHFTALIHAVAPAVRQGAGVAFTDHERPAEVAPWFVNTCQAWRENGPLHRLIQAGDEAGLRGLSAYPRGPEGP